MKTYNSIKADHHDQMNKFQGIFFAFNNSQFDEGMEKIGLKKDETKKIVSIGGGGYLLKEKLQAFKDMLKSHDDERKALKKDRKLLLDALVYELTNHEYCYTRDASDALEALNLKEEDIPAGILAKAKKKSVENCDC